MLDFTAHRGYGTRGERGRTGSMAVLVTGAAGFVGYHVARGLAERGAEVVGLDNFNAYYDVAVKEGRAAALSALPGFTMRRVDLADAEGLAEALSPWRFETVIHLAAQAGVRYSIENPQVYAQSNLVGHLNILEFCRHQDGLRHLVYASSSSVYGGVTEMPWAEHQRVDTPVSLYAATKRANELMSHTYAHLYGLPQTGLRFFTVYGEWGRPDMAVWLFTDAILAGRPIKVFNRGEMRRDFTYIDDIVAGVLAVAEAPPAGSAPHRVYNIGNNRPERLMDMIATLEATIGREAEKTLLPMQPGDVPETYADITAIARDHGFTPRTPISEGLPRFVDWYRAYRGL